MYNPLSHTTILSHFFLFQITLKIWLFYEKVNIVMFLNIPYPFNNILLCYFHLLSASQISKSHFTFFVIIDHFFKKVTLIFWQTQIDHLCRLSEIFIFEQGLYPHAFARTTGAIHKLHYAGF